MSVLNAVSILCSYPAGYDESDRLYNILYLLHGSNGSSLSYLDPETPTKFQNLLDHLMYTYFYHILPCLFIDLSTVQNDALLNPD